MARPRHLCVIHDNVDTTSSIGKLAMWAARTAIDAGWQVTVVARDLDESLGKEVTWRKLYVPPRLHLVQWAAARWTIPKALGDRRDYGVIHTFQAQVAALADVYHVQYLSAPAREAGALEVERRPRAIIGAVQKHAVTILEERYLRRLPPTVAAVYCSELVREEFGRRYAAPLRQFVIPNPSAVNRTIERRDRPAGAPPVWGYLGGWDQRKGYEELFAALRLSPDARLVFAGPGNPGVVPVDLMDRVEVLGHLRGLTGFFASIDVLAVPSRFEPYGMVVGDAAAHGVPCVVSPAVGAAPLVTRFEVGSVAADPAALARELDRWAESAPSLDTRCAAFVRATSEEVLGRDLLSVYDEVLGGSDRRSG